MTGMHAVRRDGTRRRPRGTAELACVFLLVGMGMLALVSGGGHREGAIHGMQQSAGALTTWSRALHQGQDLTPIPDSALPGCQQSISLPLGGPTLCVDPVYWIVHGVVGLFNWLVNWIIAMLSGFIQGMVANDLLFDTPTALTTQNQAVTQLAGDLALVANGAFALIVLVAGFNLIIGTTVGLRESEAKELLPRLVLGAAGANLSLWLISQAVDGTNTFMHAVAAAPYEFFVPNLANLPPGLNVLFITFFGALGIIVYQVLFVLLIFQIFTRVALLDLLIIIAPLAIVCWILPQTRRAAEWWLGLLTATLVLQPMQLLVVSLGTALASNLLPNDGIWGIATILLQIGLLVATFFLAVRLPALLNYGLFRTVGAVGNPIGLAMQLATFVAGLAAGAGGAAAAGAGAGAGGGTTVSMASPPAVGGGGGGAPLLGGGTGGASDPPPGLPAPGLPAPGAGSAPGGGSSSSNGSPYDSGVYDAPVPPDGADPRPGAGTIVEGSGYTIDDGGPL